MPKFKILKEGINEALFASTYEKIENYLGRILGEGQWAKVDGVISFDFGSANIKIRVVAWHSEDVLVEIYSYVAENVEPTGELMEELLRLNALHAFGSFGLTLDNTVEISYCLPGANLSLDDFTGALQTVASVADNYDERIRDMAIA